MVPNDSKRGILIRGPSGMRTFGSFGTLNYDMLLVREAAILLPIFTPELPHKDISGYTNTGPWLR